MDLKGVYRIVSRYMTLVLFIVLSFSGGALFLWNGYKDLNENKVSFEKEKNDVAKKHFDRELELQKREFLASQIESKNAELAAQLKAKELELTELSTRLNLELQSVGVAQVNRSAEEKLQALMSEFSAMGVNLNTKPRCGDDQVRYNTAKSKFDEVDSWAVAHSLENKYSNFLSHNRRFVISVGCVREETGAFSPQ